ncbi:MAG: tetratricopeptide repeat protein [Bacteroidales bacterium]
MKQNSKTINQKPIAIKPQVKKKGLVSKQPNWHVFIVITILLLTTWLLYKPTLGYDFTNWDDPVYVLENPHVKKLNSESIKYFFSNSSASNYHPLTMLSLALDYKAVSTQKTSPKNTQEPSASRFHATNVILHLFNVILVFVFAFQLSRKRLVVACITALLFAIHPMHVESVAWIAERKDVLYTFFFFAGLIVYLKYLEQKRLPFLMLTLLFFILSLFSKPSAVVFPLVLLAIDYFNERKFTIKVWVEKVPFLALSAIFGVITVLIQSKDAIAKIDTFSMLQRLMFAAYGSITYLFKLLLPIKLSAFYPYPTLNESGSLPVIFYLSPIIVLALAAVVYFSARYTKIIVFGFLFYLISLVLVLQFVSVGSAIMADRYTYVAAIGIFFIIAWYVDRSFSIKDSKLYLFRWPIAAVLILFIGFSGNAAFEQVKVWKNSETLWTDVISKYPQADVSYKNRANYYGKLNLTDKALADYNIYVKLKPNDPAAYSNIGNIYGLNNQIDKSLDAYSKSIAYDSVNADTYLNRAITYAKAKQFDLSLNDYNKALSLKPGTLEVYMNRSYTLLEMGRYEESIKDYTVIIDQTGGNDDNFLKRGLCYYFLNKYPEALENFSRCVELNSSNATAYYNTSVIYNSQKDYVKAYQFALKAQSLNFQVSAEYLEGLKSKQ